MDLLYKTGKEFNFDTTYIADESANIDAELMDEIYEKLKSSKNKPFLTEKLQQVNDFIKEQTDEGKPVGNLMVQMGNVLHKATDYLLVNFDTILRAANEGYDVSYFNENFEDQTYRSAFKLFSDKKYPLDIFSLKNVGYSDFKYITKCYELGRNLDDFIKADFFNATSWEWNQNLMEARLKRFYDAKIKYDIDLTPYLIHSTMEQLHEIIEILKLEKEGYSFDRDVVLEKKTIVLIN